MGHSLCAHLVLWLWSRPVVAMADTGWNSHNGDQNLQPVSRGVSEEQEEQRENRIGGASAWYLQIRNSLQGLEQTQPTIPRSCQAETQLSPAKLCGSRSHGGSPGQRIWLTLLGGALSTPGPCYIIWKAPKEIPSLYSVLERNEGTAVTSAVECGQSSRKRWLPAGGGVALG